MRLANQTEQNATGKIPRKYRKYTDADKQNLFALVFDKGMSTNASAIQLDMPPSTAYSWIKKEKEQRSLNEAAKETVKETVQETVAIETVAQDQRSVVKECRGVGGKLEEEYEKYLAEIIEEKLAVALAEITKSVTAQFTDLIVSKASLKHFVNQKCKASFDQGAINNSPVRIEERYHWAAYWENKDMNYMNNCVFIDRADFHVKLTTTSKVDTMTPSTKTVFGAISNQGVVNVSNALSKRTEQSLSKMTPINEAAGLYFTFIKETLDIMDRNKDIFEDNYLIMDHASLHNDHPEIQRYIEKRGYRCIILPSHSSELSPMKQFWSACKNSVRKETLITEETWPLKLKEACHKISLADINNFCTNSAAKFDNCLDREPI